jgi:hypothetical protein
VNKKENVMNSTNSQRSLSLMLPARQPSPRATFDAVVEHIRRFYDAPDCVLTLLGLYVMVTHVTDAFDAVPYLQVVGEPATGKTRLGELVELLAYEARLVARMSVPAVYRFIEEMKGTLIIDEQGASRPEMRNILNAGYKRSGKVMIVGAKGHLLDIPCFGPKVLIANHPELNEALASRLITIVSQTATRPLERFLLGPAERNFAPVVSMLRAFADNHRDEVAAQYNTLPPVDDLSDRDFDLGAPLLAIANVVDRSPGTPIRPLIEAHLIELAERRKDKRNSESESVLLARLIIEYTSVPRYDARKNPPAGEGLYLASELCDYVNKTGLLVKRFRSTKVLAERLSILGLIKSRHVLDVDPACAPSMSGRLRIPENTKRPRIQRVVYAFDMERARSLAGEVAHA